ncbi:MAG: SMC-Scp complex subunit ScpB [Gemmatimonadota bacterium]
MKPSQIVEAVLFSSDAPLKAEEIARADEALDEDRVEEAIQELQVQYNEGERAFHIEEVAEGYQILTRPEFAPYLERFDTVPRPSRLSGPALETLAIIAYRQPIGRIEIEYIRGVSSAGVIRSLQDRALVEVVGRRDRVPLGLDDDEDDETQLSLEEDPAPSEEPASAEGEPGPEAAAEAEPEAGG